MPTNANTFNSRVTSEALEAKFRQVFPSQGGAELPQDLFASGVITPVVDFSTVAEGSVLPVNLQTAWDFSTGHNLVENTSTTVINNSGFWQVDLTATYKSGSGTQQDAKLELSDGLSTKEVWQMSLDSTATVSFNVATDDKLVVFLRSGDTLSASSNSLGLILNVWYRQIADVNGTLVNPLGFTFS